MDMDWLHGSRSLGTEVVYAFLFVILFDCHDFKLLIDMKFITVSL